MSHQLKRINPFWHTHPMVPTLVAIGGLCGLIGFSTQMPLVAVGGAFLAGAAILFAARPVISAVLGTMGILGGLLTFVIMPTMQASGMTLPMRVTSAVLFALFYMVLMDAVILVVSVLYNLYSGVLGMGGIRLELEGDAEGQEEDA